MSIVSDYFTNIKLRIDYPENIMKFIIKKLLFKTE
jgi:hypothetical protein